MSEPALSATNLEFKTRLKQPDAVAAALHALGAVPAGTVRQRDTYFVSEHGRLKLRETDGGAEVISYERTEDDGARWSHYRREPVPDAAATRARLAAERGVRGVVEKTRAVWHTGRSRVHLDYVNGLGDFLEIEVVQPEPPESGPVELAALLAALGLDRTAGIAGSYIDLLEAGM